MASVIGAVAHERRWRIVQLLQQWLDMRCVIDFLVRQIESGDLVTVSVDADMKLAPGSAFRSPVAFLAEETSEDLPAFTWKTSAPQRTVSFIDGAPRGIIMNS
jgi:hypothetical protein